MRIAIAAVLAVFAAGFSATAVAVGEHEGHGAMHGAAHDAAPMAEGVVKKIDLAGGKLTISHGPLPNGMAPMTMAFALKDKAWAKQFKEGDRIRFALDDAMTLVRFERIK